MSRRQLQKDLPRTLGATLWTNNDNENGKC